MARGALVRAAVVLGLIVLIWCYSTWRVGAKVVVSAGLAVAMCECLSKEPVAVQGGGDGSGENGSGGDSGKVEAFTYHFPPTEDHPVRELTFRFLPEKGTTVVTAYYPSGTIYMTKPETQKKLGIEPGQVIHTEHPLHVAALHRPDDPYEWHSHVELPSGQVAAFISRFLGHYGPAGAEVHASRVAQFLKDPRLDDPRTFPDGEIDVRVCDDRSGLGLLVDIRNKWGTQVRKDGKYIKIAAERIRPTSGDEITRMLLERYDPNELVAWTGPIGGLQHYIAKNGGVRGLELLASTADKFDINRARKSDRSTVAHLAAYRTDSEGPQILAFAKAQGANPKLKNKYGETFRDLEAS